jgi:hypothetical protein
LAMLSGRTLGIEKSEQLKTGLKIMFQISTLTLCGAQFILARMTSTYCLRASVIHGM